ncbi:hypothetical protein [Coxiella-like endosymbiont of Rhipicephalus sanguineus]|uniref:hypothetical protein n=1 Tax=Coxiella-like endosymbiont of Rhipicephalus sanguineus TaxID=1955402 RepID=UPI00203D75FF|nr:hypothetical protein [Coxiella-like endosymbiont of Rhipicephalus sanguineus]
MELTAQTLTAELHLSSLTDNLSVNLKDFPIPRQVIASYINNNGVDINGATFVSVTGSANLAVQISSHNPVEKGYPIMTIFPLQTSTMCQLRLIVLTLI